MQRRTFLIAAVTALSIGGPVLAADADYLSMPWDKVVEAAKGQSGVTFYTWWGEEFWRDAGKDFEARYGIPVRVIVGDRAANIGKVVAESSQAQGTIDVLHVGGVEVKSPARRQGALRPAQGRHPRFRQARPESCSPSRRASPTRAIWCPCIATRSASLYDPQKVPKSAAELGGVHGLAGRQSRPVRLQRSKQRRLGPGLRPDRAAEHPRQPREICRGYRDGQGEGGRLGQVWSWLNANESKFTITASNNDSIDRVNQGEVAMAAAWDDDTSIALAKGTLFKRAKLYIPSMGLPGGGDTLGIPANAPNKAAALLFISYLTEAETQKKLNAVLGSYLARTDVAGESALLPEEQRQKNGVAWLPGPYKKYYIEQFVSQVLQQ
jgi:putative spermidine/putrescine transport system substrate-binding protein